MSRTISLVLSLLLAALVLTHALQVPVGQDELEWTLFWQLRLPRVAAAAAVGALLALCGAAMQSVFRNPLAEPTLIGVSGGAALGAALGLSLAWPVLAMQGLSFGLALLAMLAVWLLARQRSAAMLILAGVAINTLCGSLLSLLLSQSDNADLRNITFWLMGGLGHLDGIQAAWLWAAAMATGLALWPCAGFLNQMLLGEANAYFSGYAVGRWRLAVIALASFGSAAVVAQTGSIGFIALMAPHMARLLWGGQHRVLLWTAPGLGALLCVLADDLSRTLLYPSEIPIGVVTSMVGVPFFLWLLRRRAGAHHD